MSCDGPPKFDVPLFAPYEYSAASQTVHTVMGLFLIAEVLVWACYIFLASPYNRVPLFKRISSALCCSRVNALRCSGLLQLASGVYLVTWPWIFLKRTHLRELFAYSSSDLLQLQHTAIGLLNMAGGVTDLLLSFHTLQHWQWHVQWAMCMSLVGMVFAVHPQPGLLERTIHTSLGAVLILGSIFMLAERFHSIQGPAAIFITWHMVGAGLSFTTAGYLLIFYSEHPAEGHAGYHPLCHHGWPVTLGASVYVLLYGCALVAAACQKQPVGEDVQAVSNRVQPLVRVAAQYSQLDQLKEQLEAELEMSSLVRESNT